MRKLRMRMNLQHFGDPEANLITADKLKKVREVDFTQQFTHNSLAKLIEVLGVTRKIPMMEGTTMYLYTVSGTLQSGAVAEGDIIPLSQYEETKTPVGEISLKKWRKAVSAEAIKKSGYNNSVVATDAKLLKDVQAGIRSDFFTLLNGTITGSTSIVGSGLQEALANAWAQLQVKFEDDTAEAVHFLNPLDVAPYLAKANITTQTAFGMNYVEDFLGLGTVILTSRITQGTFISTAKQNIVMYYLTMNGDIAQAFQLTADELGYIGIKSGYQNEERAQIESLVMSGIQFFVEYAAGVIKGTIDDSFLTDLTVAPDDYADYFDSGKGASDIQSDIAISGGEVTGELKFIEGGIAPGTLSGDGYFLGLKFSNFASGLTYANVKVGIVPSSTGMDLQTLDSDKNAVFKVTDKDSQKIKVVQTDAAGHSNTQLFGLSHLELEATGV